MKCAVMITDHYYLEKKGLCNTKDWKMD